VDAGVVEGLEGRQWVVEGLEGRQWVVMKGSSSSGGSKHEAESFACDEASGCSFENRT